MIEVELKIPIYNKEEAAMRLKDMGFVQGDLKRESDIYFDKEDGQIKNSDSALRIRSCENLTQEGATYYLTYKGPKLDAVSKTRKEVEVAVQEPKATQEILVSLGYTQVYPVVKLRQYYHKEAMTACLDQVEGLGDFLELEMVIAGEVEKDTTQEKDAALETLVAVLNALGCGMEDTIRTSYIGLLQRKNS